MMTMVAMDIDHQKCMIFDLGGGVQYKEGELAELRREGVEISENKFIAKEVIYWGAVEIFGGSSLRQFKTTANGS